MCEWGVVALLFHSKIYVPLRLSPLLIIIIIVILAMLDVFTRNLNSYLHFSTAHDIALIQCECQKHRKAHTSRRPHIHSIVPIGLVVSSPPWHSLCVCQCYAFQFVKFLIFIYCYITVDRLSLSGSSSRVVRKNYSGWRAFSTPRRPGIKHPIENSLKSWNL